MWLLAIGFEFGSAVWGLDPTAFAGGSPSSSGYLISMEGFCRYIGSNRKAPKGGGLREKMEPGSAWGTLQKHEVQQAHVAASKIPLDIRRKHPWGGQNHSPQGVEILETQLDTTPYLTLKLALP